MWGQKLDQSPNLISFFSFLKNWETFQAKNSATNFFLSFFPLFFPLFSFVFPLFWGVRMMRSLLWCLQQIPSAGLWFLFEILNEILSLSSWDLNHLLLLALSLSLSLHLCIQSLLLPTAIAAFSTLFFSVSSSYSVQEEFRRENQTRGKQETLCSFCSCKSRSFSVLGIPLKK